VERNSSAARLDPTPEGGVALDYDAREDRARERRSARRERSIGARNWVALAVSTVALLGGRELLQRADPPPKCASVLAEIRALNQSRLDGTLPPDRFVHRLRELRAREKRCRW
jgi:hypothetical protein